MSCSTISEARSSRSATARSRRSRSHRRSLPSLPGVPTIAQTLPGFVTSSWVAVVAPPKTPPALAKWLSWEFANALQQPRIKQALADLACEPVGATPEATSAFISKESERWKSVIKDAKISL